MTGVDIEALLIGLLGPDVTAGVEVDTLDQLPVHILRVTSPQPLNGPVLAAARATVHITTLDDSWSGQAAAQAMLARMDQLVGQSSTHGVVVGVRPTQLPARQPPTVTGRDLKQWNAIYRVVARPPG